MLLMTMEEKTLYSQQQKKTICLLDINKWIVDSKYTKHMTLYKYSFITY